MRPPRVTPELLERDAELNQATTLLDRATGGQGGGFCIRGPAGVGKTALLRAVVERARAAGATALTATAGQLETQAPYGVVRRLLGRALEGLDTAGPAGLAAAFVLDLQPEAPVDQATMFTSLAWLVDALATRGPLLLCVDDAQWADEASLLFLGHLLAHLDDQRVLVVVAARDGQPDLRAPALAALLARRETVTTELRPLSVDGVHTVLERTWEASVGPEVSAACAQVTGGNPFLVRALAELLHDGGAPSVDRVWDAVPRSVVDGVVQRLGSLGPDEQEVARWTATLDTAPVRHVAALSGLAPGAVERAADRLRDAGLLADGPVLAFRHALLRSAVDAAAGDGDRAERHRAAARLLAAEPHGRHLAAAQLLATDGVGDAWAVDLLTDAARDAVATGAPQAAAGLLARAVAEPPEPPALPAVLLELGLAQLRAGDPACVATLERAETEVRDPVLRAQCALALVTAYNFGGFYDRSAGLLTGVLADLGPEHGDLALVVEALLVSAALQVPGRVADARRRLDARPDLAGTTPGERLFLVQQASYANATQAPLDRTRDLARLAIGDGLTPEQHPEAHEWAIARLQLAATGEYAEVVALCEQGLAVSAGAGSVVGFVAGSLVRGVALLWAGDLAAAELDLRAAARHTDVVPGGTLVRSLADAFLVEVLVEWNRIDEAVALLDADSTEVATDASFNGGIHLLRARGFVRQAAGDHVGALRELEECARRLAALDVDSPTWCSWRPAAVASHWALGELEQARSLAADDVRHAETKQAAVALGIALRVAGEVADPADALTLLGRSVEVLARTEARLEDARARLALGSALRRAGHRAQAREELLRARAAAARCHADRLLRATEEELAAAGGRPRRLAVTGVDALTASERRVCELAAGGLRNRDIAQRLFVAPKTVEVHLSRSYRKLGISRRDELAAKLGVEP